MVFRKTHKVYKVVSKNTDLVYIGSTKNSLALRWANHQNHFNLNKRGEPCPNLSCFKVMEFGDCSIELLEDLGCIDSELVKEREAYWINKCNSVNQLIPRTKEEHKKIMKENFKKYYHLEGGREKYKERYHQTKQKQKCEHCGKEVYILKSHQKSTKCVAKQNVKQNAERLKVILKPKT